MKSDLASAAEILDAATRLSLGMDSAENLLSGDGFEAAASLQTEADDLESVFSKAFDTVSGTRTNFGVLQQLPPARGILVRLTSLEDKMKTASHTGMASSEVLKETAAIAGNLLPLLNAVTSDTPDSSDLSIVSVKAALTRLSTQAQIARAAAQELRLMLSNQPVPSDLDTDMKIFIETLGALELVGRAGSSGFAALEPVLLAAEESGGGLLHGGARLSKAFDKVGQQSKTLEDAVAGLSEAGNRLNDVRTTYGNSGFARHLERVESLVGRLEKGLRMVHGISPVAAEVLGANGTRRYLVLGHSADELRATGGFVSAVWVVTMGESGLEDVQYIDTVRVDDWERLDLYPRAPLGLDENMNAWVWLMRDVSWEPDFPTTAVIAEGLFRLGQRTEVDGVIAINQWTLLRLVEALGQIPSPEGAEPLTSRNLLTTLEQGTDLHGRAYMDLVLRGILDSLAGRASLGSLLRLASAIFDSLEERELLVYLDSGAAQTVLAENGWDGSLSQVEGDYLMVVDSNVGWNKVDRNIQRDIDYQIDLTDPVRPRAILNLEYRNHSGPGSSGCVPQWLSRGTDYSQLKNACYWNYVRVYMPPATRVLSSIPLQVTDYSVPVEIGRKVPGEDSTRVWSDLGKTIYSGLFWVAAGERKVITLAYDLPSTTVSGLGESLQYVLTLQKQPGVRQRNASVHIRVPEGYRVESASITPERMDTEILTFAVQQTRDILLVINFVRDTE